MNALGQEARALIDSVSTHDEPTRADKTRVRARIAAELGVAAFATLALSGASGATLASSSATEAALTTSGSAAKGTAWSVLSKLTLSGAALSLVVGSLWLSDGRNERVRQRTSTQVESEQAAPARAVEARESAREQNLEAPPFPASTVPTPAPPVSEPAVKARRVALGEGPKLSSVGKRTEQSAKSGAVLRAAPAQAELGSTLGRELALLREAQSALRTGSPERALALAAEHRATFPEGVMKEERLGIEALAGCALGRDYKAQAQAFLRVAESSPLRARVQKACGVGP